MKFTGPDILVTAERTIPGVRDACERARWQGGEPPTRVELLELALSVVMRVHEGVLRARVSGFDIYDGL